MRKIYFPLLMLFVLILYILPDTPQASEDDLNNHENVFQFLESAFSAQVSLSDKERTMEEIESVLDPYFSKEYQLMFLDVNLHEENGKFVTYGTDFGMYFIPFFGFSDDSTKIVIENDKIYVFEYFPENHQGPVGYDSHYEGILIKKMEEQWKIADYLYDQIPERIIKKALN